jgi:hypothetical protein
MIGSALWKRAKFEIGVTTLAHVSEIAISAAGRSRSSRMTTLAPARRKRRATSSTVRPAISSKGAVGESGMAGSLPMALAICAEREPGPVSATTSAGSPGAVAASRRVASTAATIRAARLNPFGNIGRIEREQRRRRRYHPWRIDLPVQFRAERFHFQTGTAPTCNSVSAERLVQRLQPLGELGRIPQEFGNVQSFDSGGEGQNQRKEKWHRCTLTGARQQTQPRAGSLPRDSAQS